MLVVPWALGGIEIHDYKNGVDAQTFELPHPEVVSQVRKVAGGGVFDFNYGKDDLLIPRPFNCAFMVDGPTPHLMTTYYNTFFAEPRFGGMVGALKRFVVALHGDHSTQYRCDVRVGRPIDSITGNTFTPDETTLKINVRVRFTPINLFEPHT